MIIKVDCDKHYYKCALIEYDINTFLQNLHGCYRKYLYICTTKLFSNNLKHNKIMGKFDDLVLDNDVNVDVKEPNEKKDDVTPLNHDNDVDNIDNNNQTDNNTVVDNNDSTNEPLHDFEDGTEIETPDGVYTVREGNLVDSNGNVFKEAKDVKSYVESFNKVDDSDTTFNLSSLQEALGVDIKDDKGNVISFTDDAEGRAAYVKEVFELTKREAESVALNTFFQNNPIVKNFVDYVQVNGGDYTGFGKIPDRTGIEFIADNVEQHKAIVRAAWQEFGKRGDVEKYIKYLEDSGALADTAKEDLEAIKANDIAYKERIAKEAEEARKRDDAILNEYWNNVHKTIDSRIIGGYKIPEALTVERNGQKVNLTPNDFFAFVSKTDRETGLTGYQQSLANMSQEEQINRELLDAWLRFTGGSYKDLVDMAVKEKQVQRLKLEAKKANKPSGTVKINKPSGGKVDRKDILLS